jgi:DNA-binding NarL/FixJ family response regulator
MASEILADVFCQCCSDCAIMLATALVAEDHDITREGLRSFLTEQLDARVVATTGDGLDVAPLVKKYEPDLLLLDLGLPHLNGLDVLRKIQKQGLSTKVVILSMYGEDSYVSEAFELGAAGYVLKGSPLDELADAIEAAMQGKTYLSSGLSAALLTDRTRCESKTGDRFETLTDREREVLQLTAEGYTSQEIGEKLHISHRTVDKHRENVQAKLELRNVVEMATYAYRRGLIPEPPTMVDDPS